MSSAVHDGLMAAPPRSEPVLDAARARPASTSALRWVTVVGAVVGAVLYSNWVLEVVFTRTLPDPDLYISELAAADQPYGEWFRNCDLAAAVVLVVAATAALIGARGDRWNNTGWWALGIFAVSTGLDSTAWKLVCAPSSDAECAARESSRTVPLGHQLHWLSSGLVLAAAVVSLLAFVISDRRAGASRRVRHLGLFMLAALIGTAVLTGVAMVIDSADILGVVGVAQRAELAAFTGWLIYAAVRTARTRIGTAR